MTQSWVFLQSNLVFTYISVFMKIKCCAKAIFGRPRSFRQYFLYGVWVSIVGAFWGIAISDLHRDKREVMH